MAKKAVLLANLGSPDSTEVKDVSRYLREFLMDKRVIDLPLLIRTILVKGIIVPFRSPRSAEKYKLIWTSNGSPLIHISRQLQEGLEEHMHVPVSLCMRYGNPTPQAAFERLIEENPNLEEVVLVPLYPHYAMSSYETAALQVLDVYRKKGYTFSLKVVPPFYNHPGYVQTLAQSIQPFLDQQFDHLLFSYHGIPERHVRKTDPTKSHCLGSADCCNIPSGAHPKCYRHQIITTTRLTAELLGLSKEKFSYSFQSRLGADAWLRPYTVAQLAEFPRRGIKRLVVACPAFVSDCLETLQEIQMEAREVFIQSGGHSFTVVPCLNDQQAWIETLAELINTGEKVSDSPLS